MELGGEAIFTQFPNIEAALRAIYPEHPWESIKFLEMAGQVWKGYWRDVRNQKEFLEQIAPKLGIKQVRRSSRS